MNFSLEISSTTDLDTVPSVNDIYITMLPGGDYKDTAQQAVELVKRGFNPVPHFPARSMHNEKELKDYISFIENEVNCPVRIVSVGPQRHQTIIR